MKIRIKPLISALGIAALAIHPACYAQQAVSAAASTASSTAPEDTKMGALISKINQQINAQEKTIAELKAEVKSLKSEQKNTQRIADSADKKSSVAMAHATQSSAQTAKQTKTLETRLIANGQSPVITAAYLGVPSRWDAFDLVVNQSTHDDDVLLMQRNYAMKKAAIDRGFAEPTDPVLELSGKIEAQAYQAKPMNGSQQSNVDVSAAEVDFIAHVSNWVNGLLDINYDNSAPNANGGTTNAELVSNSRTYVSQAFITLGNLSQLPIYSTIGLRTLPYGHYSTYMISDPYTKNLFRIKDPAFAIGYQPMIGKLGPYAVGFLFKGDTGVGSTPSKVNNYGADLGYLFKVKNLNGDVGVSGVANIADSLGMQANGISASGQFQGFGYSPTGATSQAEVINHRVPGVNAHMQFDINQFTLYAEGNMATTHFAPQDMSYNGHGAKPAATHLEGVYSFNVKDYPSFFALGYDQSWEALALDSPKNRYISTFGISLFRNTIEDLEFKHEINYSSGTTAGGQNLPVLLPGHVSNTLTAQVGYYF